MPSKGKGAQPVRMRTEPNRTIGERSPKEHEIFRFDPDVRGMHQVYCTIEQTPGSDAPISLAEKCAKGQPATIFRIYEDGDSANTTIDLELFEVKISIEQFLDPPKAPWFNGRITVFDPQFAIMTKEVDPRYVEEASTAPMYRRIPTLKHALDEILLSELEALHAVNASDLSRIVHNISKFRNLYKIMLEADARRQAEPSPGDA